MIRPFLAVCSVLLIFGVARATDPKPLWEIDASGGNRATGFGWLAFSPGGQTIASVMVRETRGERPEYHYQLHAWNSADQKERFNADLGSGKTFHWGDDLASFSSEDTILTGGQELTVRQLENGRIESSQQTGAQADHTVWSVPDLGESFYLRRDPHRYGSPVELFYQPPEARMQQFPGQVGQFPVRRARYGVQANELTTTIRPPREGLRTESVAMNFGRTQIVAAFRDDLAMSKPRHALVLYQIKTIEELDLVPLAEAMNPHPGSVSAVAFARNGKILATGGEDGSICLWDVNEVGSSWKPRVTVDNVADHRVYSLAFSRDWRMLAAVTWDNKKPNLLLLDGETGKLLQAVRLDRELKAVAFSPDGRTLLTGNATGKLQAWDITTLVKGN